MNLKNKGLNSLLRIEPTAKDPGVRTEERSAVTNAAGRSNEPLPGWVITDGLLPDGKEMTKCVRRFSILPVL